MTLLAVDIGGTKVQISRAQQEERGFWIESTRRVETATLRRGTPRFIEDLLALLRQDVTDDVSGIALTLNGVLDGPRVVYSSLMGGAAGLDLQAELRKGLGIDAFVDDDLHAMGLAEGVFGLGREHASTCILNVGTGVGAVAYAQGDVVRGSFGAGLISEIPYWVDELGEWRILDRITCGRGVTDLYRSLTGRAVDAELVFRRFAAGEEGAARVVAIYVRALAWLIGLISRFYHPEAIALHGSLAKSWHLVAEATIRELEQTTEALFLPKVVGRTELRHSAELGVLEQGWGSHGRHDQGCDVAEIR